MGGRHPEAKAASRDKPDSPRVNFRVGLANVFQRYVERIFFFQPPSTPSVHAGPPSSHSKKQLRPVSSIEEEDYVARKVREIYGTLRPTPFSSRFTNSD